jgi:hypothetical protein
MKNIPITLSLPESLVRDLHFYVPRRQMSKFVANLVQKGLSSEREKLAREYHEASLDSERQTMIEEWDIAEGDGLNETNTY